ncbi:DUF1349 domain-containing protein, partial [bacterium]|nr:DUF1349 domain-containing protein [bacterium]
DVTAVGGGSVTLSPAGGTYNAGTVVTLTPVDAVGIAFTGWSGDLTGAAVPETLVMDANKAVTATFAPIPQFTLTTDATPGGGSVVLDPPGGVYNQGTAVQVTAVPTVGYAFDGWSGDLTGTVNPETVIVDANKSVTATFSVIPEYALTVNVVGMGTVVPVPDQALYYAGTAVELTATAAPGWQFAGWSGDLTGTANPDTVAMVAARTVTATFVEVLPVLVDDDFNGCELDPMWTFVDPFGDGGTVEIVNGYTDDAQVAITVPGGLEHEIWNGVIGAVHILQPAQDIDFTIEAKFEADLPEFFAQEGILVKQDDSIWVRAEFFRDHLGLLRVAVDRGPAQITHDVYLPPEVQASPLWMRLQRTGSTWIHSWSADGVNWTEAGTFPYTMTVNEIGLFAGNRGNDPRAHTVYVDYITATPGAPAGEDAARAPLDV